MCKDGWGYTLLKICWLKNASKLLPGCLEQWRQREGSFGSIQGSILPLFKGNILYLISILIIELLRC